MMRKAFRLLLVSLAAVALTDCGGGPGYRITLSDGRELLCKGQPEFKRKTGYYKYRSADGRDGLVRADEVMLIEEQGS
jgi:hypothetical protein